MSTTRSTCRTIGVRSGQTPPLVLRELRNGLLYRYLIPVFVSVDLIPVFIPVVVVLFPSVTEADEDILVMVEYCVAGVTQEDVDR